MTGAMQKSRILTAALFLLPALSGRVVAEEAAPAPSLMLELNAAQPSTLGCRFTFVVKNDLGTALEKAAFEIVLFNTKGLVDRLTVLDFKALPRGKTRVRQFDFPDTGCADIGRVLVNDATQCVGEGLDPKSCIGRLETRSKAEISFGS